MKKRFSFGSYFGRIYFLLLLFILIPLTLVGFICFKLMSDRTYESFRSEQKLLADDLCSSAEELIRHAEDELVTLSLSDPDYTLLGKSPDMRLYSTSASLSALVRRNSIVDNACYLQTSTQTLINSSSGVYDFEYYYDREWYNRIDYRPLLRRHPVRIPADEKYRNDSYFSENHSLRPVLSLSFGSTYSDVCLVNISIDTLTEELSTSYSLDGSHTRLTITGAGSDSPSEQHFEKDGNNVTLTGSMYYGLLDYCLEYDYRFYRAGESYYLTALCIVAAVLALCSIVLARYAAAVVYAPVYRLWSEVDASDSYKHFLASPNADELELLKEAFREINLDREKAKSSAAVYKSAASSAALSMFLEAGIPAEKFIDYAEDFSDCRSFCLTIVSSASSFANGTAELLSLYLKGHRRNLAAPLAKGRIGVLTEAGGADDAAELIFNVLKAATELDCTVVSSKDGVALCEVPDEYRKLLEFAGRAEFYNITDKVMYPDDFPDSPSEPGWNREVNIEAGIIRAVINNDPEAFREIINELFDYLKLMPVSYFKSVTQAVLLTVEGELKFAKRLSRDIIEDISRLKNFEEYSLFMTGLFDDVSALYVHNESVEQRHCAMAKEILEREYARDIDVLTVADTLSLSYPYLSKIFKNCYGTTLSDYLNSYRIEKSCELLAAGGATLETIAAAVGYNNTQSFQRFFRKYKGMTPTEYRRSLGSGKENA